MTSSYPTNSYTGGNLSSAFYPHSVNVLGGGQMNEIRTATIASAAVEALSTPGRGVGSSAMDASPYRQSASVGARSDLSKSPYQQQVLPTSSELHKPSVVIENGQQVVYSSQPMTSAEYEAMINGGVMPSFSNNNGSTGFTPSNAQIMAHPSSGMMSSSYSPAHNGVSNYFPGSSFMSAYGSMGGSSSIPQQLPIQSYTSNHQSSYLQPLAPTGLLPAGIPLPTNTQVGLTPRSYQEQIATMMNSSAAIPGDPSLMAFAETFKNRCITLSQRLATHPDEVIVSEPVSFIDSSSPALQRPGGASNRANRYGLATIPDYEQENVENSNNPNESLSNKPGKLIEEPLDQAVTDELDPLPQRKAAMSIDHTMNPPASMRGINRPDSPMGVRKCCFGFRGDY